MHTRQNIIEIFSTFLQFDADRFSGWVTDAKLRRSMLGCMSQLPQPETSENFWVLYWYKERQSQGESLARSPKMSHSPGTWHLVAYLQEACYWVAQKTAANFSSGQNTVADCFQIAIAQVDKVLKGFNPSQGFALKNYASAIFSNLIRENLRQRGEVDICTPWGLLRKISQKRLIEALQTAGLSSQAIASYVLAWNCFKAVYVPTPIASRKLPKPDSTAWNAIAALYNYNSQRQGAESPPETLEKWLLSCAKAARDYLYPTFNSLNTPREGQDFGEFLEILPGTESPSLLAEIISKEEEQSRNSQLAEINAVLVAAVAKLESQAQQLLQMYYTQQLNQQQIAQQLEIQQYTVSRRLSKARQSLLLALAQWSQNTLHIALTSDVLKDTSAVLEEWLKIHYSHPDTLTHREQPL
ncbi:sigma-70 family RNA polymerase sigma factor [Coleofasciculus sp. H7-2]|uniref:sigma-70 family RNA polymerase sigma factor n=1 Tax=Coleofasciculus sp. H7-2 TaxID=3351545 RepID=UPI003671C8EB